MATVKISDEEQEWRARADADLMVRYQELMSDAPRLKRAISAAKKKASELEEGAAKMQKAANTKSNTKKK